MLYAYRSNNDDFDNADFYTFRMYTQTKNKYLVLLSERYGRSLFWFREEL